MNLRLYQKYFFTDKLSATLKNHKNCMIFMRNQNLFLFIALAAILLTVPMALDPVAFASEDDDKDKKDKDDKDKKHKDKKDKEKDDHDDDKDFLALLGLVWDAILDLQNQIDAIQTSPGIEGPQGPQGIAGPQGIQGIPGINGTSGIVLADITTLTDTSSCNNILGDGIPFNCGAILTCPASSISYDVGYYLNKVGGIPVDDYSGFDVTTHMLTTDTTGVVRGQIASDASPNTEFELSVNVKCINIQ